jgi:hypothetical protein
LYYLFASHAKKKSRNLLKRAPLKLLRLLNIIYVAIIAKIVEVMLLVYALHVTIHTHIIKLSIIRIFYKAALWTYPNLTHPKTQALNRLPLLQHKINTEHFIILVPMDVTVVQEAPHNALPAVPS